jgi:subtilisin family serine protease
MFYRLLSRRTLPPVCRRRLQLNVELLETRTLLSTTGIIPINFPNGPLFTDGSQWNLAGGYGSNAIAAWNAGYTGLDRSPVYVGVLDEAIQSDHPDLQGRVLNPEDIGKLTGGTFSFPDTSLASAGSLTIAAAHGTHVAGVIGALGYDGIAGVDLNARIIAGNVLGPDGRGSDQAAIAAIDYFVNLKVNYGVNIVAVNASWSGYGFDAGLYDAIARAENANILFVAAAGNQGANNDFTPVYPADFNLPNVISVAAIDSSGNLPRWSNYGSQTVGLGAPGVHILSTVPDSQYGYLSGTSTAAPHVTGAIALYASYYPDATAAQIKDALYRSVVATPSLSGTTVTGGRLDVGQFLATAPRDLSAVSSSAGTTKASAAAKSGTVRNVASVQDSNLGLIILPVNTAVNRSVVSVPLPAVVQAPRASVTVADSTSLTRRDHFLAEQRDEETDDILSTPRTSDEAQSLPPVQQTSESQAWTELKQWLPAVDAVFDSDGVAPVELLDPLPAPLLELGDSPVAAEMGLAVAGLALTLGMGCGSTAESRAGDKSRYWVLPDEAQ